VWCANYYSNMYIHVSPIACSCSLLLTNAVYFKGEAVVWMYVEKLLKTSVDPSSASTAVNTACVESMVACSPTHL
jgi:hypothetical protein